MRILEIDYCNDCRYLQKRITGDIVEIRCTRLQNEFVKLDALDAVLLVRDELVIVIPKECTLPEKEII